MERDNNESLTLAPTINKIHLTNEAMNNFSSLIVMIHINFHNYNPNIDERRGAKMESSIHSVLQFVHVGVQS